jgi:hypothetical protein
MYTSITKINGGHRDHDRMVVGSTTTYAISATITPNIVRVRISLMHGLFDTTFIFYVIKLTQPKKNRNEPCVLEGNQFLFLIRQLPCECDLVCSG